MHILFHLNSQVHFHFTVNQFTCCIYIYCFLRVLVFALWALRQGIEQNTLYPYSKGTFPVISVPH